MSGLINGANDMNDKELCRLAAKAAGYDFWDDFFGEGKHGISTDNKTRSIWNPLTEDGDALRLAVKVSMVDGDGISIFLADNDDQTVVVRKADSSQLIHAYIDPYAATRRAITRAAADIGKSLQP